MWIKERYFLKEKKHIPKREKYLSESSHEGESKRGIMVLVGSQAIFGWWKASK